MLQEYTIKIRGISPLLMHSGSLIDNRNQFVKEVKRYSKRRNKTDDDQDVLQHLEWCGGLYLEGEAAVEEGKVVFSKESRVIMPADNIWACIIEGAKVTKLGTAFKPALIIDADVPLEYKGPHDLNELAQDMNFHSRKPVSVGQASIMRTRPVFRNWAVTFIAQVDTEMIDSEQLREAVVNAGLRKGLGDFRPRYGRFELVSMATN